MLAGFGAWSGVRSEPPDVLGSGGGPVARVGVRLRPGHRVLARQAERFSTWTGVTVDTGSVQDSARESYAEIIGRPGGVPPGVFDPVGIRADPTCVDAERVLTLPCALRRLEQDVITSMNELARYGPDLVPVAGF